MPSEIEDRNHRFTLTDPLSYATKSGDQETALWIELRPPTTRNRRECAALKQAFFRAAAEQGDDEESSSSPTDTGQKPSGIGVITIMAMSTKVDLADVMEVAAKLFSSGVAYVEGETKLTTKLIESMSQDDFERMLGEYLVNFTLASALAQAAKKTF